MSESRSELLYWINNLLQLNITKIEELGDGAAYAQIFDAVWGDVQMSKIKFDSKQEYEYVQNYKVLQQAFTNHKLSKVIPVERLIKRKFQDNIEFCQWVKKFFDSTFSGAPYNPVARRRGQGAAAIVQAGSKRSSGQSGSSGALSGVGAPAPSSTYARRMSSPADAAMERQQASVIQAQQEQMEQMAMQLEALEKERDYYYERLRDIEMHIESVPDDAPREKLLESHKRIAEIMYCTPKEATINAGTSNGAGVVEESRHDARSDSTPLGSTHGEAGAYRVLHRGSRREAMASVGGAAYEDDTL